MASQSAPENVAVQKCLEDNKAWAKNVCASDPNYLPNLSKGQKPEILWIGCADSRACPEIITGAQPGEIFVHRNIANIVQPTDLSSLSVIEYACAALKVQHIVLCGHSSCGGVVGALGNQKIGKIDTWLAPLRRIRKNHIKELDALPSDADRTKRLVQLNVQYGIEVLRENPDVIQAQKDRGLQVHGVYFDITTGEIQKIDIPDDDAAARAVAFDLK